MISGRKVFVKDGNIEKALRKFKKKVAESGVLVELQELVDLVQMLIQLGLLLHLRALVVITQQELVADMMLIKLFIMAQMVLVLDLKDLADTVDQIQIHRVPVEVMEHLALTA